MRVVYFAGETNWNFFTAPFVFRRPDLVVQQLEPWAEVSEVWRRPFVTYPVSPSLAIDVTRVTFD